MVKCIKNLNNNIMTCFDNSTGRVDTTSKNGLMPACTGIHRFHTGPIRNRNRRPTYRYKFLGVVVGQYRSAHGRQIVIVARRVVACDQRRNFFFQTRRHSFNRPDFFFFFRRPHTTIAHVVGYKTRRYDTRFDPNLFL